MSSSMLDDDIDYSEEDDVVQNKFNKAAEYLQHNASQFNENYLLQFYGLYKQSTCGQCNMPKPGMFDFKGRAKRDSWYKLGNLDRKKAMEMYIEKLSELKPDWDKTDENNKKSQWVCTSMHVQEIEDEIPEANKTAFDYIRENNLEKLKTIIDQNNVNGVQDENGMFLIHWATDRNAPEILGYLISVGADVNIQDSERQTALHYASSCGHLKCLQILLENGADKYILDVDGYTCVDIAYDEMIKTNLLSN